MPRSKPLALVAALLVLLVFVAAAWLLGSAATLGDGERRAIRVALALLGVTAAALTWRLLRPRAPAAPAAAPDDALVAVAAARARLPRGGFDARPLVLVLGSEGKRQDHRGRALRARSRAAGRRGGGTEPVPTRAVNVWLVRQAVLAEAGGPLLSDAARWQRLVRALRAPGLAAAIGRRAPAARAAVVCVSCDLFDAGAAGQLDALAQVTRARLTEAARELGVQLPVYVLFTKADRIPHFEAWAAALTRDEAREPLGAALPWDASPPHGGAPGGGTYAERLVPRLETAFAELVGSLAARRPELLAREATLERRLAAYELPRELRKLAPAAVRFLVELGRPMQLGVGAQLRGFYFVGARPVLVADAAPAPAAMAAAVGVPVGLGQRRRRGDGALRARHVGRSGRRAARRRGAAATRRRPRAGCRSGSSSSGCCPRSCWADAAAGAAARGGVHVARARRLALGAAAAAGLVLAAGATWSWLGNRALAGRTREAARRVAALPAVTVPAGAGAGAMALPSAEALRTLEGLRALLDTLGRYAHDGAPLGLRWGLWQGDDMRRAARQVWLAGYERQLHAAAWAALVDSLRALPPEPRPTDDYGRTYEQLKAYLVSTTEPARSTPELLAPVLLSSWERGQPTDAEVRALARAQFAFHAGELARDGALAQTATPGSCAARAASSASSAGRSASTGA
jgi:type VI secretion system protein ImpL